MKGKIKPKEKDEESVFPTLKKVSVPKDKVLFISMEICKRQVLNLDVYN